MTLPEGATAEQASIRQSLCWLKRSAARRSFSAVLHARLGKIADCLQ